MDGIRYLLRQELMRRISRNSSYSLRAFARHLGINHATLSSLMSGKRKITLTTARRLGIALDLSPDELNQVVLVSGGKSKPKSYHLIEQDEFSVISEWYFDAILELSAIPGFTLKPSAIARSIGISESTANLALSTLIRVGLLATDETGNLRLRHRDSINILDDDYTSAAHRRYQKSVLAKALEALDSVPRKKRDHTSTTIAIDTKDVGRVKELIRKFRHDLDSYLQRGGITPTEVYQLQVAFFPLSCNSNGDLGWNT